MDLHQNTKAIASGKRGCMAFMLVLCGLAAYVTWQVGEPGRRAKDIQQDITMGMSVADVEGLLTGRHLAMFQMMSNGVWTSVSRNDVPAILTTATTNASPVLRMQVHMLGMSPRRASFFVEFDAAGKAIGATPPRGWD